MQNRTTNPAGRAGHPVFALLADEGRSLKWLAARIGRSQSHVRCVKSGLQKPGAPFRARCAVLFGLPEHALFVGVPAPAEEVTAPDAVA